MRTDYYTMHGT